MNSRPRAGANSHRAASVTRSKVIGDHAFPYRAEERVVSGGGEVVQVARPTVEIVLTHEDRSWRVKALIDTGAPFTLFDRATADALGLPIRRSADRRTTPSVAGRTRLSRSGSS